MGVKLNDRGRGSGYTSASPDYMASAKNTFGSDPEFFIVSKRHGTIFSPHRFEKTFLPEVYGEKNDYGMHKAGEIHRDGPALEVNPHAATCRDNQVPFFFYALQQMQDMLKNEGLSTTHKITGRSRAKMSKPSLKDAPEDVSEFGCNPDINAYTLDEKSPTCPVGMKDRFAGGHIHMSARSMSYDNNPAAAFFKNEEAQADTAIAMDVLLGFPAVGVLGPKYAEDERVRRQFYGQAGSYRSNVKENRFEYRTLSNTAFALSPILMSMWLGIVKYFPFYYHKKVVEFLKDADDKIGIGEIRDAINTHNYEFVWESFPAWIDLYPEDLHMMVPHNIAQMFNAAQNGTTWDDDILFNWGVGFAGFKAKDHAYWGHEGGYRNKLDKIIFPGEVTEEVNKLLEKYSWSNHGYDVDRYGKKTHPSVASPTQRRSWERG